MFLLNYWEKLLILRFRNEVSKNHCLGYYNHCFGVINAGLGP